MLSVPFLPVLTGPCWELNFYSWAVATDRRRENEAALVGKPLYLPGQCPWGSIGVGRAEPLAPLRGKTRWFKVVLVNTPLSLHLWCQWVQKDLNLYPPSGRQGEWLECKLVPHSPLWCLQSHVGS